MSKSQTGTKTLSDFKVTEIRKVLIGRGLDGNGVKATLIARLEKALADEGVETEAYFDKINAEINGVEMETKIEDTNVEENSEVKKIDTEIEKEDNHNDNRDTVDLIEKTNDEIDQAELDDEDTVEVTKNESNDNIHVISDAEDIDEMIAEEESNKQDTSEIQMISDKEDSDRKDEVDSKDIPKLPSGLQFPKDDPEGKRCIWISGIPIETKLSDMKLAFMDGGFTGEAKIFLTKDASHPTAFGFMILETEELAKGAVGKMNNSIFKGKTISVERACDSSMLQSDLMQKTTERQRIHPPIVPPEKDKPKVEIEAETQKVRRERSVSPKVIYLDRRNEIRRRRSPPLGPPPPSSYHQTVARARIVREQISHPQRRIISNGPKIRVVAARSPDINRRIRRSPSPLHRRREDDDPRRYEEMLRRKEEEFLRKERALKAEVEAKRAMLEKERLERENLELKLRLKEQERSRDRPRTPPPFRRRSPPFRKQFSPVGRRQFSPSRRPISPRRNRSPPQHRNIPRRTPPRIHNPRNYRDEPPKDTFTQRRRSRSRSPIDRRPMNPRIPPRFDDRRDRPYDSQLRRDRTPTRLDDRRSQQKFEHDDRSRNLSKNEDLRDNRGRNDRLSGNGSRRIRGGNYPDNPDDPPRRDSDYQSPNFNYTPGSSFQSRPSYSSSNSSRVVSQSSVWPSVAPSTFTTGLANASPWPSTTGSGTLQSWSMGNAPFGASTSIQNSNPNSRYRF